MASVGRLRPLQLLHGTREPQEPGGFRDRVLALCGVLFAAAPRHTGSRGRAFLHWLIVGFLNRIRFIHFPTLALPLDICDKNRMRHGALVRVRGEGREQSRSLLRSLIDRLGTKNKRQGYSRSMDSAGAASQTYL
jgi:hypothetical protein